MSYSSFNRMFEKTGTVVAYPVPKQSKSTRSVAGTARQRKGQQIEEYWVKGGRIYSLGKVEVRWVVLWREKCKLVDSWQVQVCHNSYTTLL